MLTPDNIPDAAQPQLPGWGLVLIILVDKVLDWFSRRGMGRRLGRLEETVKKRRRLAPREQPGTEDNGK
jgi:hypothetical protein